MGSLIVAGVATSQKAVQKRADKGRRVSGAAARRWGKRTVKNWHRGEVGIGREGRFPSPWEDTTGPDRAENQSIAGHLVLARQDQSTGTERELDRVSLCQLHRIVNHTDSLVPVGGLWEREDGRIVEVHLGFNKGCR